VASLADYDQVLLESAEINRMEESLKLFKEMCDSEWFRNSHIILLLNKKDLFEEKIKSVNPKDFCFPNYSGGLNEEEASKYFTDQFFLQNTNPDRMLYHKKTCALDKDNIEFVFKTVKQIIFYQNAEMM